MVDIFLDHDTTEEDLAAQLPSFMPKDPDSGNYKLLATIAAEIDTIKSDLESVDRAATVQHADTIDQLEKLGRMVNLKPEQNESREHYRARILAEYQLVTSEGTVMDLLNGVAEILDTDVKNIQYTEENTLSTGECQVSVQRRMLNEAALSDSEVAEIIERLIAGEYRARVLVTGTFTYLSTSDYSGGSTYSSGDLNSDPTLGHDGLDSNDDPKGNGGTYAGTL